MSNEPGSKETVLVVLSCLHTNTFTYPPPKIGEYVFCYKCDGYKRAAIRPNAYRIECKDCTKLRDKDWGAAKFRCEIAADKHARRFPGHRVRVYVGDELVGGERMHTPLLLLDGEPPY